MECPSCGNENRDEARFCDACGFDFKAAAAESSAAAESAAPESAAAPDLPPEAPPPGAPSIVADRFEIGRFLGRGGRKDVYLARDSADGREVALAIFDTEGLGEAVLARARREMQAMERLGDHPHVVSVFDTGEDNGTPYIVSRFMPGGDVQRLLAQAEGGRVDVERAVQIAIDVCRALEHAHSCGIVHRDLKPANVWLAEDGSARLGDFGLAATGPERGGGGGIVGTVAYLPPEQALGRPSGPRADLYSLGAMLYEMVAGRPPFVGDDAVSIIGQHLNSDPVAPSRHCDAVPATLDRLILSLLTKSAEERPESAAAVREELEAIRDAPPEQAGEEGDGKLNPLEGLAAGVFVGREAELSEMQTITDGALAGRGRLVLLAGEPGIGKTRTAEELATYAQVNGAKVHWGRCHEGDGAPAYWPWIQVIRSYVREADPVALAWEVGSGAAEIARVVPELAERLGQEPPEAGADDEQARFRLFDAISTFLTAAAASRPLVVVLDDLHWADEPSLLLLQFLTRSLGDSALLVIGTYRDVELGRHHPLSRISAELASAERTTAMALRGLELADVGRYIEMSTGTRAPPALVEAVYSQTEGNPFFLAEVVRLLASEGRLSDPSASALSIPQGVRDVVGRRLNQLPEEANRVLAIGAAIGRVFEEVVLERVTDQNGGGEIGGALDAAKAAQLVVESTPGRFRFSHALVRETLYGELSATQRPLLHHKIAEALEDLYCADPKRLERHLAELAHHHLEAGAAGDPHKAVAYATRAGEQALEQLGYEEAANDFERALQSLDLIDADDERRAELLVALGEAQTKAGRLGDARVTLERAADLARAIGSTELLCRAALGIGYTSEVGSLDEKIVEILNAALDAIGSDETTTRVRLIAWLGQEYYWVDPQGRSRELTEQAIEMARRVDDDHTLAFVLSRALFTDITPGASERGLAACDEVMELSQRTGDRELELRAHVLRVRFHLDLGDIPAVDRELEAFAKLATELRQPQHLWHIPLLRGTRALIDGRLDQVERLVAEAREGGERAQEPLAQQFTAIQISVLYRHQGRLAEIVDSVDALARRFPAIRAWRIAHAYVNAQIGRIEEARAGFERLASSEFAGIPFDTQLLTSFAMLCELSYLLGDEERAPRLHERLAPYRGYTVVAGRAAACWGPVSRYLGLASATAGELDRAVEELSESIALSERMGDRPFLAETRRDLAAVLLKRAGQGDRERAIELLNRCLDTAQELGMPTLSERALALKLEDQGLVGIDITSTIDEVIIAVENERPDISRHAAPDGTVTILFSDIENSTLMTEALGDARWIEVLREHNEIFRERLRSHDGYEVKNQGDGFMLVFPSPTGALRCAIEVQQAFEERSVEVAEERIRVRMGLHTGEAIADDGDFFGRNVILAARIAAKALGAEILVSSALKEQAEGEDGLAFDEGRELELKGMAGTHHAYAVQWQGQAEPAAA